MKKKRTVIPFEEDNALEGLEPPPCRRIDPDSAEGRRIREQLLLELAEKKMHKPDEKRVTSLYPWPSKRKKGRKK